jgi:transmembrane sensor
MIDADGQAFEEDLWETAATWALRARSADFSDDEAARLDAWLEGAPERCAALMDVLATDFAVREARAQPQLRQLAKHALARHPPVSASPSKFGRRRTFMLAASLAGVAVLGGVFAIMPKAPAAVVIETSPADRREVGLADGSHVSLDKDTRISVRLSQHRRDLTLERGQAEFDVAHQPQRPFVVLAAGHTVEARGTRFTVDMLTSRLAVTLLEGRVIVAGQGKGRMMTPIAMTPAQRVVIAPGKAPLIESNVNIAAAVAWKQGKLVFDDEPLVQAIERLNRYSTQKITLADSAVGGVRVSGVFDAGSVDTFVGEVTAVFPVKASRTASGGYLLHSAM